MKNLHVKCDIFSRQVKLKIFATTNLTLLHTSKTTENNKDQLTHSMFFAEMCLN